MSQVALGGPALFGDRGVFMHRLPNEKLLPPALIYWTTGELKEEAGKVNADTEARKNAARRKAMIEPIKAALAKRKAKGKVVRLDSP